MTGCVLTAMNPAAVSVTYFLKNTFRPVNGCAQWLVKVVDQGNGEVRGGRPDAERGHRYHHRRPKEPGSRFT